MKSMTGFGRSSNRLNASSKQKGPAVELEVSIKAVNGRYLDIRFHVPREFAALEGDFKNLLTEKFSRGTLDVYLNRARGTASSSIRVNASLAKAWLDGYRSLGRELKLKAQAEPSLELITRMPEVFELDTSSELSEKEAKLAKQMVKDAADACDRERTREGKALANELNTLCERLETIVGKAEAMKDAANAELERRMLSRLEDHLKKLGYEGKIDEQRLAQEVVISLDRADISEELMRLKEHLKAYRQLLKSGAAQGKKLDFYAQELLREVNTIGSKSHLAALTNLVVDAKTVVEKIREQVQNVE